MELFQIVINSLLFFVSAIVSLILMMFITFKLKGLVSKKNAVEFKIIDKPYESMVVSNKPPTLESDKNYRIVKQLLPRSKFTRYKRMPNKPQLSRKFNEPMTVNEQRKLKEDIFNRFSLLLKAIPAQKRDRIKSIILN